MANKDRDTLEQLRSYIDSDDTFMTGHRILIERKIDRVPPDWAMNDARVQEILTRSFPRLKELGSRDAERAGRWARIIHLFFRMGETCGQVATELELPYKRVDNLIWNIRKAAYGLRADGSGPRTKKGRPRRVKS